MLEYGASLFPRRPWVSPCRKGASSPAALPTSGYRHRSRPVQYRLAPLSAYKSNPNYNKYRSRQTVEKEYYREWERTAALTENFTHRQRTLLSTLASLPGLVQFYLVPGPISYVWFWIWQAVLAVVRQVQRRLVLLGSKLEASLLQRAGQPGGVQRRMTLLRWHNRIPLVEDLKYWANLLQGKLYEPRLRDPEPGDYGPNYMPQGTVEVEPATPAELAAA